MATTDAKYTEADLTATIQKGAEIAMALYRGVSAQLAEAQRERDEARTELAALRAQMVEGKL